MKKASEPEKVLFAGLRKYPIIAHKNFTLFHSGGRGDDYFDIDLLTCNPLMQPALIEAFKDKIENLIEGGLKFDKIAFIDKDSGPTGVIVLASSISQQLGKDIIIIRPWKRLRFAHVKIKGLVSDINEYPIKQNDEVLLIDDVINTGGTQTEAIELVETFGAKVTGIVCAFIRDETKIDILKERKQIEFLDKIFTYEQLLLLGFILPNTRDLLSADFLQELNNSVASKLLDESEASRSNVVRDLLDKDLDEMISQILDDNKIEASDEMKQGLKNIYFSGLSKIAQSSSLFE